VAGEAGVGNGPRGGGGRGGRYVYTGAFAVPTKSSMP